MAKSPPISVHELSKFFPVRTKSGSIAKDERFEQKRGYAALKNVSFEANVGDSIALIGRNGAGKTTLLRCLAGVTPPSTGTVEINGDIASVLTLRAGLDPRISGTQTVYTLGALMGVPVAAMKERLDEIVDFSEVGPFIDQPLNTYSPGMAARLAFATATHIDATVLLIDEVIGVGDPAFQTKAAKRIEAQFAKGMTTVVSSHNLGALERLCNKALWIHDGKVVAFGELSSILPEYRKALTGSASTTVLFEAPANTEPDSSQPHNEEPKAIDGEYRRLLQAHKRLSESMNAMLVDFDGLQAAFEDVAFRQSGDSGFVDQHGRLASAVYRRHHDLLQELLDDRTRLDVIEQRLRESHSAARSLVQAAAHADDVAEDAVNPPGAGPPNDDAQLQDE